MMSAEALAAVLRTLHGYAPTLDNGLTLHAPMLATALVRLGADDALVTERVREESKRAVKLKAGAEGYASTFHQFKSASTSPALDHRALNGLAGAGFHGLIRLAYALESGCADEVAAGWAYLRSAHTVLPPYSTAPAIDLRDWASALRAAALTPLPERGLIVESLVSASKTDLFSAHALDPESVSLTALAALALEIYFAGPNIDTLHAVTGVHALRVVLEQLGDSSAARLAMGYALIAMMISSGAPAAPPRLRAQVVHDEDWATLAPKAFARDAHTVKFLYTCREEWTAYHDAHYFSAAQQRILKK
jgi:hypothetical protein